MAVCLPLTQGFLSPRVSHRNGGRASSSPSPRSSLASAVTRNDMTDTEVASSK
eukprot:CAMPEP_0172458732 /NCGR_PEP_ID=MMETSP1065-20121228/28997_1 /TAXON_ID=265537 /ORGANISM="Amphiprora paludosa, Strain CCMP125" /LENGTH=52 /DNA_ID=CAMNT_0013213125 /DNA_START=68 /DNA_END=223 /DNA_ORIENTATION=-